ncbi:ureidoglycolate hydrolase [Paraburkholderia sp. CNPSo 3157]|uniref:Ureidoglycolate hydrolase n=1 Tax=Paraburkholderia franconis TaxID=2654983 RepID=A0A7X1NFB7_9BURK|nr:ureidoglycolate lyase [Paraburkholderia franconis]MPW20408.1 ureidoglycolate hydrolase [Paraburkholderia franconis]
MKTVPLLNIEPLTPDAFARYGWVLGNPVAYGSDQPFYNSDTFSIWREHLFDAGAPNETEILWSRFKDGDLTVRSLETRWLTQEAVVPLTGPLIQIVAVSDESGEPDIDSVRAFIVPVGMGTCVRPQSWYAIRILGDEVEAFVLSRRSATNDLIAHRRAGRPTAQSKLRSIAAREVVRYLK